MAVIEDSVHRKKSRDDLDEIPTFNVENMQNNTRIINCSRTFMSIIGGVVAGILGFTGLMGFILYFHHGNYYSRTCCKGWVFSSYFDSWNQIILDGILGGLMSFVLFWMMKVVAVQRVPAMIHVLCLLMYLKRETLNFDWLQSNLKLNQQSR